MRMMKLSGPIGVGLLCLALLSMACSSSNPPNGTLKCGVAPTQCPDGYACSDVTGTCWLLHTGPDAGNADGKSPAVSPDATVSDAGDAAVTDGVTKTNPPDSSDDVAVSPDQASPDQASPDLGSDTPDSADVQPDLASPDLGPDVPVAGDVPPDLATADAPVPDLPVALPDAAGSCGVDKDCPGPCQTCSTSHLCVAATNRDDPTGHCAGTCDTTGVCKAKPGQACASPSQCATGSCSPEGLCCDRACNGTCESCDFPANPGVCSPVTGASHTNHGNCNGTSGDCGGSCTGASNGQCTWPTSACGQASCTTQTNGQGQNTGTTFTGQGICSAGACNKQGAVSCSGDFVCASATACKTTCGSDSDCLSGRYCSAGTCTTKYANGHTCGGMSDCSSGKCVDGVCCSSDCAGTCQACNVQGKEGTCSNVAAKEAGRGCESTCDGSGACTGNGVCGFGYTTCTRSATILHRISLACADGTKQSEEQLVDLSNGYRNYTCQNNYHRDCIDDGSFDAYNMDWCDYAAPSCVDRGGKLYSCDPGAKPSGTNCTATKVHRKVLGCDGTLQSAESVIDLSTGYSNYTCDNQFMNSCVTDGSWDGYYMEWCEYQCS